MSLTAVGGADLSAFFPLPDEHIPCGEASWVKKKLRLRAREPTGGRGRRPHYPAEKLSISSSC